ncbi:hypothetical protein B0T14DRAFT_507988 [Immersiella caudata]|uniref:Uncharacterized protein n=1 Tax=Immersiella caudata TaxID=314043 RepID=A0AA40CDX6_9PEZI|nr:hypothetical protein B0T14DRAFT_507988 [Immersiella caudata]
MRVASLLPALLAAVHVAVGAAVPNIPRSQSGTCVADDLLRFFRSHRVHAAPFCREYLGPKVKTVTVTESATLTQTTLTTETSTDTVVSTSVVLDVSTVTVTSTEAPVPVVTLKARYAGYFNDRIATEPPASISSACSCLKLCLGRTTTSTTTTVTEDVTESQTTTTQVTTTIPTTVTSSTTTTTTTVVPIPTYPTQPFRMYTLDGTGARQYLDRRDWVQGDVVASTPDASLAETFVVDADQYLFFTDGFSTGTIVYAFYGPEYFGDDRAKVLYFNTPESIAEFGFIYHVWTVDLETLSIGLADPARMLQLCDRAYNSMLMVGNVVDSDCVGVSLFMEYV